jgi:hypothetical protein
MTYPIFRRFTLSTIEVQASTTAPGGTLSGAERRGSPRVQVATPAPTPPPCGMAIESLPPEARPGAEGGPRLLARADSAGATHAFAAACRQRGVGTSFGFPVNGDVRLAICLVPEDIWEPAIEADGSERDGDLAEPTGSGGPCRAAEDHSVKLHPLLVNSAQGHC